MEEQMVRDTLTEEEWTRFDRDGYVRLGRVMDDEELALLGQRIDDIMLGTADIDYRRTMMQLDSDPERDGKPGPQSKGRKGATLAYRKIQDLEYDAGYLAYMQKPLMRHICERVYGEGTSIACFRAMFMNKPAHGGTELQWHQDRWRDLDRDPQITVWAALNDSTIANGCVKIVPGSHDTLRNPESGAGFLTPEQIEELVEEHEPEYLELKAGEGVLLHNWMLHSSEMNSTDIPRRAFSVCYLDAETVSERGHTWNVMFGEGALALESIG
ncbi:MAG: phytanoyl-CoA dioxygenase [Gemmatimonadetes bacterium]|nr:phytanoyl-CoA dioxygenase [Gemmatimonadota bacterium]